MPRAERGHSSGPALMDAPVLCDVCRSTLGATIIGAGMIRDDELPPRCALCGFRIAPDGHREPEPSP
jgi:hypothetical protein